MLPSEIYQLRFKIDKLVEIYEDFISDGAAVGRDGVSVDQFRKMLNAELDVIYRKVAACSYSFTSYKEKLISKGATKPPRRISIPTVRDKLVLKFLSELLSEIYPDHVSRMPHSMIRRVHEVSSTAPPNYKYLRLDIENFFPSIDHSILMRIIKRKVRKKQILHLINDAISTPTGTRKVPESLSLIGIPQGLSISNILSSLYLSDIDAIFESRQNVFYFRFVDDILMIGPSDEIMELSVLAPKILKSKTKIKCHEVCEGSKSVIVPLADGIDYLGYRYCLSDIEVRNTSFKKMFANIMKIISAMKYSKRRDVLIWKLNLRISGCKFGGRKIGWLFFFSQSKNTQQLKQLDAFVSTQARRVLTSSECKKVKTFIKAYHEIRFNVNDSSYIHDFDCFEDVQMKLQIRFLNPDISAAFLDGLTSDQLSDLFRKCISREVADLERDMMEFFS